MVSNQILDELPSSIRQTINSLPEYQKSTFEEDYLRKRKSKALIAVLSILFLIQLFLLGRTGLGIAFILTGGGLYVWWIIEWFYSPLIRVPAYNESVARELLRDIHAAQSIQSFKAS